MDESGGQSKRARALEAIEDNFLPHQPTAKERAESGQATEEVRGVEGGLAPMAVDKARASTIASYLQSSLAHRPTPAPTLAPALAPAPTPKPTSSETSTPPSHPRAAQLFSGLLQVATTCLTCERESVRCDEFMDLSLPVGSGGEDRASSGHAWDARGVGILTGGGTALERHRSLSLLNSTSITHGLSRVCGAELLLGDNKYHCTSCHTLCEAERIVRLARLPRVLTLHINRGQMHAGKVRVEGVQRTWAFFLSAQKIERGGDR